MFETVTMGTGQGQVQDQGTLDETVPSDDDLVAQTDRAWDGLGRAHRAMLALIAEVGRREVWRAEGAQHLAHWVAMRYGLGSWRAMRWAEAAQALERLPRVADALKTGRLGIDQVVELVRLATPETQASMIGWAETRAPGTIRARAERERRREREEVVSAERDRRLGWWYDQERTRFYLEAELPADQGTIVERALARVARGIEPLPGEEGPDAEQARAADALVAVCSGTLGADPERADPEPGRATLVIHAPLAALTGGPGAPNGWIPGGPVLAPASIQRMACDAKIQLWTERDGVPLRLGRTRRLPSASMLRALHQRDEHCRFPGCDRRRFTNAHHVRWWSRGGRTDLDNLVLICGFHHRLVHERGWGIELDGDGTAWWFTPRGARWTGRGPPGSGTP